MTGGSRSGFGGRSVSDGRGASGSRAATANLAIGQVLAKLRAEFPDISPSKIRFLEAEGLILPQRAESGYRRFAVADIERQRYILTAQRDEYLPLRVIKERLAALDGGGWPGGVPRAAPGSTLIDGPLDSGRGGGASAPGGGTPGNGTPGIVGSGTGAKSLLGIAPPRAMVPSMLLASSEMSCWMSRLLTWPSPLRSAI